MNIILKKILFRDLLFLFILAVLFAVVYGRALTFPPRSDYWHIFYVFSHGIKDLKDLGNILTFETFGHPRFQPLAFLILYVEYAFFGSVFILYNLFNQLVAFIILVELYFLMKLLTDSFIFPALLTLLGAFLMSHFDIFTWSYHVYILVGVFCIFASVHAGYFYYIKRKKIFLILADIFLLIAVCCYEAFFFIPLILFILFIEIKKLSLTRNPSMILNILGFYLIYFLIYLAWKTIPKYYPVAFSLAHYITAWYIITSLRMVSINIFCVNLLINCVPFLGMPISYYHNTAFTLARLPEGIMLFFQYSGIILLAFYFFFMRLFTKKNKNLTYFLLLALIIMLFSYLAILSFGRLITNGSLFVYAQFRYQFFPNLLMLIICSLIIREYVIHHKKRTIATATSIVIILVFNIILSYGSVLREAKLFEKDKIFLNSISRCIEEGVISKDRKIYIDPAALKDSLFWNEETGNFPGNIQWFFKNCEDCFTEDKNEASVIAERDFSLVFKKHRL